MHAPFRRAVWPNYRTRPRLNSRNYPTLNRTFRSTAVPWQVQPPSDPNTPSSDTQDNHDLEKSVKLDGKAWEEAKRELSESRPSTEEQLAQARSQSQAYAARLERLRGRSSRPIRRGRQSVPETRSIDLPAWFFDRCIKLWDNGVRATKFREADLTGIGIKADAQELNYPSDSSHKFNAHTDQLLSLKSSIEKVNADLEVALEASRNDEGLDNAHQLLEAIRRASRDSVNILAQFRKVQKLCDESAQVAPSFKKTTEVPSKNANANLQRPLEKLMREELGPFNTLPDFVGDFQGQSSYYLDKEIFFEVKTAIAASLAVASGDARGAFPALKSNLALYCAFEDSTTFLNSIVDTIAKDVEADVLHLNAQDLAELGGSYVSTNEQEFQSLRTLGYDVYQEEPREEMVEKDEVDREGEEDDTRAALGESKGKDVMFFEDLNDRLHNSIKQLQRLTDFEKGVSDSVLSDGDQKLVRHVSDSGSPQVAPIDNSRLSEFLDCLIEAVHMKRSGLIVPKDAITNIPTTYTNRKTASASLSNASLGKPHLAKKGEVQFSKLGQGSLASGTIMASEVPSLPSEQKKLIICIEDFMGISTTPIGEQLVERLAEIVQRRRMQNKEHVMIVGTVSSAEIVDDENPQKLLEVESEASFYRTIIVTPKEKSYATPIPSTEDVWSYASRKRNESINLRNLQTMLVQLRSASARTSHTHEISGPKMEPAPAVQPSRSGDLVILDSLSSISELQSRVLKLEEIHRIAMTAIGLQEIGGHEVASNDIQLALELCRTADQIRATSLSRIRIRKLREAVRPNDLALPRSIRLLKGSEVDSLVNDVDGASSEKAESLIDTRQRLAELKSQCNHYEKQLFGGVVHPGNMRITFSDVHVATEIVDAVRTLTSLSLLRPDAFKYGVLANDTISGLLLYGPPGTGKTLLAKAVAKESGATVLTITGSDINHMYVGESEKTVRAIFTLARKLSPCVVFIDEADSLLAARQSERSQRVSHRDTINQFLLEWDGLNDSGVFLMVATNRPFDLDDAVLRRLPRRVLVDLPTKMDRESILRIHLKGEDLDNDVSVSELAANTLYYSGSDLKNLAVAAALACVKEETAAKTLGEANGVSDFKYPERRRLAKKHFDQAMGEIAASISGDMSSLQAIKKFDEQYGDRKGRRKKTAWGFIQEAPREEHARVRG